jgi:hypothetical protein
VKKRFIEKFPEEVVNTYETLKCLRKSSNEYHYNFLDNDDFLKINYPPEKYSIYWKEMLKRIHIIILLSCFKTLRWIEAIDDSINNFYGFCSSLRGLIESISDTFYTLYKVPSTIATDFHAIKEQIEKRSLILTNHQNLESELLHYIQATKLNKLEKRKYPKYLNAKQIKEYIKSIDDKKGSLYNLYSFLCSISHPAYESNCVFLLLNKDETIVFNDSIKYELTVIDQILEEHSLTIRDVFRRYMNILYSTILLLNKFEINSLSFHFSNSDMFEKSPVWKEIKQKIDDSELRYKEEIAKGKYT